MTLKDSTIASAMVSFICLPFKDKKYALTHNNSSSHLKTDTSGHIVLNAANLRDDLVFARDNYFNAVEASSDLLDKLV